MLTSLLLLAGTDPFLFAGTAAVGAIATFVDALRIKTTRAADHDQRTPINIIGGSHGAPFELPEEDLTPSGEAGKERDRMENAHG